MAPRDRVKVQRLLSEGKREAEQPLTREDLKGLVQALGQLVRDSVRAEVAALREQLERMDRKVTESHRYIQAVDAFTAGIDTKITDMMAREAQRLGRERDLEHRSFLGKLDLARHPERPGATMAQLAEAEKAAAAFRAGEQAQRESDAREDGIKKRDDRPVVVDGEVVIDESTMGTHRVDKDGKIIRGGLLGP